MRLRWYSWINTNGLAIDFKAYGVRSQFELYSRNFVQVPMKSKDSAYF